MQLPAKFFSIVSSDYFYAFIVLVLNKNEEILQKISVITLTFHQVYPCIYTIIINHNKKNICVHV